MRYYNDEDINTINTSHIVTIECPRCKHRITTGEEEIECECGMIFEFVSYVVIKYQEDKNIESTI